MSDFNTTDTGADTTAVDYDHDGDTDGVYHENADGSAYQVTETNDDGRADVAAYDRNEDGRVDAYAADTNNDGRADYAVVDNNYDGRADVAYKDTDGDGDVDYTTTNPTTSNA